MVNDPGKYEIRSVTRALDVLIAVSELGEADLTGVARAASLHPTTTLRILESLRSRNFIRQRKGRYEIGARAFEVGSAFLNRVSLAHEAQSLVEEASLRLKEAANLGILVDGEVLYLAIAQAQRELGIQTAPGGRHPAHCTALGKVLLAELEWESVEEIIAAHPPVKLTAATIVEPEALERELARVRRVGYAVDAEERTPGVVCIAAPIRDVSGSVVAALSISGPRLRLPKSRIPSLAREVIDISEEASQLLGAPAAALGHRG